MKTDDDKTFKHYKTFAILAIFGVWLIYFIVFKGWQGLSSDKAEWAAFGDYFGGVLNPILSFITFLAVLWTIKISNDQLKTSKKELELTRDELEGSKEALKAQAKTLRDQVEDKRINDLLNHHERVINTYVFQQPPGKPTLRGRETFPYRINNVTNDRTGKAKYYNVFKEYESSLRYCYQYINKCEDEKANFYRSLLLLTITVTELDLLQKMIHEVEADDGAEQITEDLNNILADRKKFHSSLNHRS